MVTPIENQTGDERLDGAVAQGLVFALQESPELALLDNDAYQSVSRTLPSATDKTSPSVLARQVAEAAGAKAYLHGSLISTGDQYTLSLVVLSVADNHPLTDVQETVVSRDQIPEMIDRAVEKLRTSLVSDSGVHSSKGEDSTWRSDVSLSADSTKNLEALHAYSMGETAEINGRMDDAVTAYQAAVALDSKFVQAEVRLSWLYRWQHAEVASADIARQAAKSASDSSERTKLLVRYTYEANATGKLDRAESAIRRVVEMYPNDASAELGLAQVLWLEGRAADSLAAAQRGIQADPYNSDLYQRGEIALIALDRYKDALALEQTSKKMASAHDGVSLIATYLSNGQAPLTDILAHMRHSPEEIASLSANGLYLDDSGRIAEGARVWNTRLSGHSATNALIESDQWLVAQGALDRALVGDCTGAQAMAKAAITNVGRQGLSTNFAAGMGAALCGNGDLAQRMIDVISSDWPQSTIAQDYELPELRAAVALGAHDPQVAFDALLAVQKDDPSLLAPYLRGLAHVGLHQTQFGISDFQSVMGHRGAALVGGSDVFPASLSTLAKAYAESGDMYDSVQANRRLLEMWRDADGNARQQLASQN